MHSFIHCCLRLSFLFACCSMVLLMGCKHATGDPSRVVPGGRYVYSQRKADKEKRAFEKKLQKTKAQTVKLKESAETLTRQIAALSGEKTHQTEILNSPTSTVQEKSRAQEKKQALERQIDALEKKLDFLVRVS